MGGFSIWHWMIVAMAIGWAFAVGMILKRLGFNPWWAALAVFPLVNFIGIWVVALANWPLEERAGGRLGETFE